MGPTHAQTHTCTLTSSYTQTQCLHTTNILYTHAQAEMHPHSLHLIVHYAFLSALTSSVANHLLLGGKIYQWISFKPWSISRPLTWTHTHWQLTTKLILGFSQTCVNVYRTLVSIWAGRFALQSRWCWDRDLMLSEISADLHNPSPDQCTCQSEVLVPSHTANVRLWSD